MVRRTIFTIDLDQKVGFSILKSKFPSSNGSVGILAEGGLVRSVRQ